MLRRSSRGPPEACFRPLRPSLLACVRVREETYTDRLAVGF